jgi:hypothetical protein
MPTLLLQPDSAGYVVTEPGDSWLTVELPGGLPRTRADVLNSEVLVNVSWICKKCEFDYIVKFEKANSAYDYEPFDATLQIDDDTPAVFSCRFVAGSFKIDRQEGETYFVSAVFRVVAPRTVTEWPT